MLLWELGFWTTHNYKFRSSVYCVTNIDLATFEVFGLESEAWVLILVSLQFRFARLKLSECPFTKISGCDSGNTTGKKSVLRPYRQRVHRTLDTVTWRWTIIPGTHLLVSKGKRCKKSALNRLWINCDGLFLAKYVRKLNI